MPEPLTDEEIELFRGVCNSSGKTISSFSTSIAKRLLATIDKLKSEAPKVKIGTRIGHVRHKALVGTVVPNEEVAVQWDGNAHVFPHKAIDLEIIPEDT